MSLFLTRDELEELTGYVRPSAQIRWLRENAVRHFVAAGGHPRVPRSEIDVQAPPARTVKPDFEALKALG